MMSSVLYLIFLDAELLNIYVVFIIVVITCIGRGNNAIIFTLCREYNAKDNCEETATGFVSWIITSAFIGQYLMGYLIDYHWKMSNTATDSVNIVNGMREYTVNDYQFAFKWVIPSCLIVSNVCSCLLKETNGQNLQ